MKNVRRPSFAVSHGSRAVTANGQRATVYARLGRAAVLTLLVVLAPWLGACASASAAPKTKPADMPGLSMPPPPPRAIEPAPAQEPGPDPVGDLPAAPASSPPRAPRREPASKPAEPKAEPKTDPAPTDQPPPPPPESPQPPVPQLSTPQTADSSESAKTIRATIDRARAMLGAVNFLALSAERQKAYNDAKMFLDQADAALKQGNYTFAQGVAVKAETLARELAGR